MTALSEQQRLSTGDSGGLKGTAKQCYQYTFIIIDRTLPITIININVYTSASSYLTTKYALCPKRPNDSGIPTIINIVMLKIE